MNEPLEAARKTLSRFYRLDQASAFDLRYSNEHAQRILVLYFESHRGRAPIWIAIDNLAAIVEDEKLDATRRALRRGP